MHKPALISLTALIGPLLSAAACADSTLEYVLQESSTAPLRSQPVMIKDGRILLKGAGGDDKLDVLYSKDQEKLVIIDHRKRSYMPVEEQQVNQISRQTEDLQPLLQGFGKQIRNLSPEQRKKWEQMLGGNVSLEQIASAAEPVQQASIVKTGLGKNVAGIACEQMNVLQGKSTIAEVCLANPDALQLSGDDYATIRSLFSLSERIAEKTHGLASQFGVKLPNVPIRDVLGVPVEMRDLSGKKQGSVTLSRIVTSAVTEDLMQIPGGYRAEKFSLWK